MENVDDILALALILESLRLKQPELEAPDRIAREQRGLLLGCRSRRRVQIAAEELGIDPVIRECGALRCRGTTSEKAEKTQKCGYSALGGMVVPLVMIVPALTWPATLQPSSVRSIVRCAE